MHKTSLRWSTIVGICLSFIMLAIFHQPALGAPTIESMEATPDPVAPGVQFTIKVKASADVTFAFAQIDFRPTLPMFFPVQLIFNGIYWTNTIPFIGITFPPGVNSISAIVRATVMNAARQPAMQEKTITVKQSLLSVTLEAGLDTMNINVGDSDYIAFTINFQTGGATTYHVIAEQTVSPFSGITWTSDYPPGGWTTNTNITWVINEQVFGNVVGTYELKKTVKILETGNQTEVTVIVNVLSGIEEPQLLPLGSVPDGVNVSVPTDVTFTTTVTGSEVLPSQVILERVDAVGNLLETLG